MLVPELPVLLAWGYALTPYLIYQDGGRDFPLGPRAGLVLILINGHPGLAKGCQGQPFL